MSRTARVEDIHETAAALPRVSVDRPDEEGRTATYRVAGKPFLVFRAPRPDAVDPESGERYGDVVIFWVEHEGDKEALVGDATTPWFTTPHFAGHSSVLVREAHLDRLEREEVVEMVHDAWLARAPKRLRAEWLLSR